MEYTFTLKYRLGEQDADAEALVERLGDAGCDDALAGTGQPGRLGLEFTREAASAAAAIRSALADVKRAAPSARLVEAAPDFVGLTDVAELVGVSRQNMRKLMLAHRATFPAPVHEGSASIWHLADLLEWLQESIGYSIDAATLATAKATLEINSARAARRLPARTARDLEPLLA